MNHQVKRGKPKGGKVNDKKLWKVFSLYIRLKFSDDLGYCTCYTCGAIRYYTDLDCGHGIGRQYKATKFHEKNNRPQCKPCNGLEGGKREAFKAAMDKEHGPGTWELLEFTGRQRFNWGQFEVDALTKFYAGEVERIKKTKHFARPN